MQKIGICGKGGSGKSVIVQLLAEGLRRRGRDVLVVDADESNTGLHRMLGFDRPPRPLIDLLGGKQTLESRLEAAVRAGVPEMKVELVNQEMQLADIPPEFIFTTSSGIRLVSIGKILMALEGCACPMGIVSRSFLKKLRLGPDEVAVIDLEAGVEHFGRGVETSMDCVLVVVEPSLDSLEIAARISELSQQIDIADVFAVLNKVADEATDRYLRDQLAKRDITVIGTVHYNQEIFASGLEGRPIRPGVAAGDIEPVLDFLFP